MPAHKPVSFHLQTERLTMRLWAESDVDDYRALVAERDDVMPTVENIRARIATQLAAATTSPRTHPRSWRHDSATSSPRHHLSSDCPAQPAGIPQEERHPGQHDELLEPGNDFGLGAARSGRALHTPWLR